jgi:hypothetical protein
LGKHGNKLASKNHVCSKVAFGGTLKDVNAYQLALDPARMELADAQRQQRSLNLRVSQLEALVSQLQSFLGQGTIHNTPLFEVATQDSVPTPVQPVSPNADPHPGDPPIWKALMSALTDREKADFTAPQALEALTRTGRRIPSQNRLNIVRNILIGKENIFGRFGTGHYFVRGYEKKGELIEKEVSPEEKTS